MVITEYGVASLSGRTVRERAQALIEVAHPDDRAGLVDQPGQGCGALGLVEQAGVELG